MSNASQVALAYVKETEWGTTPASALKLLRYTSENIKQDTSADTSKEIRSDRQVPGQYRTDISASGTIGTELSFGAFDDLIEGFMMSSWTTVAPITITNGSTFTSFTFEKNQTDIGQFEAVTGAIINGWKLNVSVGSPITAEFDIMGKKLAASGATVGTGAPTPAPTNEIMNTIDNITDVKEGGAAATIDISEITIDFSNNGAAQMAIGNLGPIGIRLDTVALSGTLNAYMEDVTLLNKYLNFNTTSLEFTMQDADANSYIVELPRIRFTDGNNDTPNSNSDVMVNLSWTAELDTVAGYMIKITKSS